MADFYYLLRLDKPVGSELCREACVLRVGASLDVDDFYYLHRPGKPVGSGDKFLRLAEIF